MCAISSFFPRRYDDFFMGIRVNGHISAPPFYEGLGGVGWGETLEYIGPRDFSSIDYYAGKSAQRPIDISRKIRNLANP